MFGQLCGEEDADDCDDQVDSDGGADHRWEDPDPVGWVDGDEGEEEACGHDGEAGYDEDHGAGDVVHHHAAKDSEKAADYCEGCEPGYELERADADDVADAGRC